MNELVLDGTNDLQQQQQLTKQAPHDQQLAVKSNQVEES